MNTHRVAYETNSDFEIRTAHILGLRRLGNSLEVIGAEVHLTRERVRQIIAQFGTAADREITAFATRQSTPRLCQNLACQVPFKSYNKTALFCCRACAGAAVRHRRFAENQARYETAQQMRAARQRWEDIAKVLGFSKGASANIFVKRWKQFLAADLTRRNRPPIKS